MENLMESPLSHPQGKGVVLHKVRPPSGDSPHQLTCQKLAWFLFCLNSEELSEISQIHSFSIDFNTVIVPELLLPFHSPCSFLPFWGVQVKRALQLTFCMCKSRLPTWFARPNLLFNLTSITYHQITEQNLNANSCSSPIAAHHYCMCRLSRWASEWWLYSHILSFHLAVYNGASSLTSLSAFSEHTPVQSIQEALHYHFPLSGNFFLQIITLALSYLSELHYLPTQGHLKQGMPPTLTRHRLCKVTFLNSLAHLSANGHTCAC